MDQSRRASASFDVVIVGGGIWGLSTAYHLAETGRAGRVLVLDRNAEPADETTRQAAGQIGQLRSHPLMVRAVRHTLELFRSFQANTGHDPGLHTPGSLHLALCPERLAAFQDHAADALEIGLDVELLSGPQAQRLVPGLDASHIEGALYVHGDGYIDARRAALALAAAARDRGVELRLPANVTGFVSGDDGGMKGVRLGEEVIAARHVVITAGPWTALLAEQTGFVPPVEGIRLQQARTVADPAMPVNHPVVRIPDQSCYLRPERGGYLFGLFDPAPTLLDPRDQPGDFATRQIAPSSEIMAEARRRLVPVFPVLERLPFEEYRQGMLTCTPDGWYVLGPVPGRPGLWLATGCQGMGIAGSGAVGRWLARWIVDGDPGDDLRLMAPDRFAGRMHDREQMREACRRTFANYYSLRGGVTYQKKETT